MANPIKSRIKTEVIPIILILVSIVAGFYFYVNFPEKVPIHWNAAGEVDGWGSKFTAAILMPIVMVGIYLLFLVIPYIDPKKERYNQFTKVYHIFKGLIIFYMVAIYFISSLNALGYNIPVALWIPMMVGILFVLLGNYMSKIKPNWFMGIRTPWTLSSEEVWNKTHRLGGKLFILGGIVLMLMYFIPASWHMPILLIIVFGIVIVTMVYSYLLFREEEKNKKIDKQPNE